MNAREEKNVSLGIKVPVSLHEALAIEALRQSRTKSNLARLILEQALLEQEPATTEETAR
ncbi:MAG: ribbon-helix-helix domain-containing protein [Terrimicrobiaceae bacterium]